MAIALLLALWVLVGLAYFLGYQQGRIDTELDYLHDSVDKLEQELVELSEEISGE